MESNTPMASTVGRPRDPRTDDAVRHAARSVLLEVGYRRTSYELVAKRAGVSRPTIYRRWPSKPLLIASAVFTEPVGPIVADTGDLEADLRALASAMVASMARPETRRALPGLLSDLDDPGQRRAAVGELETRLRGGLAARLESAAAEGHARPDADVELLLDVLIGASFNRLVARAATTRGFVDGLARALYDCVRPMSTPAGREEH